jgi:WD40 repeat protein
MSAGQTAAYGVAFSPSGKVLVTTDTSGVIRLWDVTTHQRIGKQIAPKGRHEFLLEALSPNGKILATTQFDGPAQLWHLNLRTRT